MGHDSGDSFELARDRGARIFQGMDPEERTAFISRSLINAAVQTSDIPEELRSELHATADRLAEETTLAPDAVAIEAFRLAGYRAEVKKEGGVSIFHATRITG